jgi:hypothetical protein
MKWSNYLGVVLTFGLVLTGCQIGCEAEKVVTAKFAQTAATLGNCTHPEEIQKDLMSALDTVHLCTAQEKYEERCKDLQPKVKQGPIANVICPLLSSALVAVVGTTVPARYGCSLSGSPLSGFVLQACESLPF